MADSLASGIALCSICGSLPLSSFVPETQKWGIAADSYLRGKRSKPDWRTQLRLLTNRTCSTLICICRICTSALHILDAKWKALVRSTNVYRNFRCTSTVVSTFDWSWSEFVTYIVSDPSCENIHVRSRFFWQTMGLTSGQHCTTLWHKTERNTFALMQQTNTEMGTQWKHILEGASYISSAKEGFPKLLQYIRKRRRIMRVIIHRETRHAKVFLK